MAAIIAVIFLFLFCTIAFSLGMEYGVRIAASKYDVETAPQHIYIHYDATRGGGFEETEDDLFFPES